MGLLSLWNSQINMGLLSLWNSLWKQINMGLENVKDLLPVCDHMGFQNLKGKLLGHENSKHIGDPILDREKNSPRPGFESAIPWEADLRRLDDAYEILDKIGSGSFGTVSRGRDRTTGEMVAIKMVDKDDARREIVCFSTCTHPSIIGFKEVVLGDDISSVFIVMELADCSLKSLVLDKEEAINENRARMYMLQLIQGVAYMHSKSILHRDLKTSNLLLTNNDQLKICDFGISRHCLSDYTHNECNFNAYLPNCYSLQVGTHAYLAPEISQNILDEEDSVYFGDYTAAVYFGDYTAAVDMWSSGCILAELVCRKQLFGEEGEESESKSESESDSDWMPVTTSELKAKAEDNILNILKLIPSEGQVAEDFQMLRQRIPSESLSPQGFDLLTKLLAFQPQNRITANDALCHPWFTEVAATES